MKKSSNILESKIHKKSANMMSSNKWKNENIVKFIIILKKTK